MHKAGQQALLARRLVEAGVSVVGVRFQPPGPWHDSWDDHPCGTHVFGTMKGRGPLMDQALTALIKGPGQPGTGPAGDGAAGRRIRTHAADPQPQRCPGPGPLGPGRVRNGLRRWDADGPGHWRHQPAGERPSQRPIKPQDVLATVYRHMGINPRHEFVNFAGRPLPILPHGNQSTN
ncbi:MAG: hypothetical protein CM1200mP2_21500 [Planctomycetaceae bacterium]|nr:MAG: hypothetical protein CM1200mP2_21500 [Planctomycetaceae bacterium]